MTKTTGNGSQFLTFMLGKEVFALNIETVREVLEVTPLTEIPRTPSYMGGVINLRGRAIPVMEMRTKLGLPKIEQTVDTCVIIIEVPYDGDVVVMGILVDSVREVFEMHQNDIEPAPKMGAGIDSDYINGMGRQGDIFVIIIDTAKVFSKDEMMMALDSTALETNQHVAA